ncbi:DUF1501 domain-containing protein [Aureliella helgolandensis]|uniref:Sulfatase n=1 Tax=Aureliella helgolandensis TaxID=2527968 RepID=A0A518G8G8_9BACT|nr:DUF1501 domain-containing protein [Aureliella helgolandensis]QDV24877.1 hypothetical protein Q31a_31990 [Aureliella helgolandensis]
MTNNSHESNPPLFCHRRSWLLGSLALASLSRLGQPSQQVLATENGTPAADQHSELGLPPAAGLGLPHHPPRAKRVIYLFQSGGPAQMDLFDYKPNLATRFGEEVPESIYPAARKTTMSSAQASFPVAPSLFKFAQHGDSGTWMSEVMPHLATQVDELCMIRSMHTDAINHDPAITFQQTGSQLPGRPSIGAWLAYGLGSFNAELPAFVAMSSKGSGKTGQPLYDRLWGSGFLPAQYQGVKFRNNGEPVLDIQDPAGISRPQRREMLNGLAKLNRIRQETVAHSDIATRIAQYEMAFQMQASVPELLDLSQESAATLKMYGPDVQKQGKYAYNCLVARRLIERGVRFVQLFHQGWDSHGSLPNQVRRQCKDTDQATAALLIDLKQRGLLDDTLVIWGGEFGRTIYSQGVLKADNYGRDHHPSCFTMWCAGGGMRPGMTWGATDDYSVNVVENPVSVHDLHATLLHLLGIQHERFTFRFQGREFRLTDVHGRVVTELLV